MKVAANIGVLDEVELIGHCVDHLRNIGVDLIVVTDVGSTDGTLDILRDLSRSPDVVLIERDRSKRLIDFTNDMYRRTVEDFGANYILALDADEFWLPASGNIRDTDSFGNFDVVSVPRFNVPIVDASLMMPIPCDPAKYDEVSLYVRPVADAQIRFKTDPTLTQSMVKVGPKVLYQVPKSPTHGPIAAFRST
jgi:glycosyltransferase involved in cell wall biosynthesis